MLRINQGLNINITGNISFFWLPWHYFLFNIFFFLFFSVLSSQTLLTFPPFFSSLCRSAYVPCEAQGLDAVQLALEQIDIVRRLSDMYARETVLATSSQDIVEAHRRGLLASLIGVEGATPLAPPWAC